MPTRHVKETEIKSSEKMLRECPFPWASESFVDMTGDLVVGIHFPDIRIVLNIHRGGKIRDDF